MLKIQDAILITQNSERSRICVCARARANVYTLCVRVMSEKRAEPGSRNIDCERILRPVLLIRLTSVNITVL